MAGGNDTAALVVALSAQLTKFEKDMKDAGGIADRTASGIEDRFSRLNPTFAGSFLGNFASSLASSAMDKAIKFVEDLKNRFLELRDVAHLTGVSMNEIFGIQQAASKTGAAVEDVTKGVRSLAVLLDQMQRGEKNSLSALFDANPQALQGINRDALTLQQTFAIVANLVQNARTEIQKIDISTAAGQSESMVKFLQKGGDEFTRLSEAAAKTAPDLQKLADQAKVFDDAWKSAIENVKAYASEHVFDVFKQDLLDIIAILGAAQKFLGLFKGGLLDKQAAEASAEIETLRGAMERLNKERQKGDAQEGNPTRITVRPGQGTSTRDPSRGLSNVPSKDTGSTEEQTAFQRTIEQITKHTAAVNADTIAVDKSNAVREQLRAEFTALNALRKDDIGVTQDQVDQYEKLRATMTAEQALEQAHINLAPAMKAAFLQASEGAKTATANYDAQREKINQLNSASQQLGSALSTAFADAIVEGKSLSDVMSSLLKTLEKAAINSIFQSIFSPQGGNALSSFASWISGARADGGPVTAGKAYIVGERRPEVFVPSQNGMIIPQVPTAENNNGQSFSPVYNINAAGADSGTVARIQAVLAQHARAIAGQGKAMQSARRSQLYGVS